MGYKDKPEEYWEGAIEEIEKKCYFKKEARQLYDEGKLTNGQLFTIKGAETRKGKVWLAAVFMNGKMIYVNYNLKDARLNILKKKGIAHLLDIVKRQWVDTRQAPWLPPRVQSLDNPDDVIHGANSSQGLEQVIGDGSGERVVKDKEKILSELEDVDVDVE